MHTGNGLENLVVKEQEPIPVSEIGDVPPTYSNGAYDQSSPAPHRNGGFHRRDLHESQTYVTPKREGVGNRILRYGVNIQHSLNPLHLYCRLVEDLGLSKSTSMGICRTLEPAYKYLIVPVTVGVVQASRFISELFGGNGRAKSCS